MFFRNVRDAVLARLDPALYGEDNVVLTATHTHAGVAGYSGYRLYNMTTNGFRPRTFQAIVDGVVASIERPRPTSAPGRLVSSRGELHDASVNRSPQAFGCNPDSDRAAVPGRDRPDKSRCCGCNATGVPSASSTGSPRTARASPTATH